MHTPSVSLNFEELGFLAGIKGGVNFNMNNPATKKILLIRRIQQYGSPMGKPCDQCQIWFPLIVFGRVEKCIVPYVAGIVNFFGADGPQWQNRGSVHEILTSNSQICP